MCACAARTAPRSTGTSSSDLLDPRQVRLRRVELPGQDQRPTIVQAQAWAGTQFLVRQRLVPTKQGSDLAPLQQALIRGEDQSRRPFPIGSGESVMHCVAEKPASSYHWLARRCSAGAISGDLASNRWRSRSPKRR